MRENDPVLNAQTKPQPESSNTKYKTWNYIFPGTGEDILDYQDIAKEWIDKANEALSGIYADLTNSTVSAEA